jgi:hypothetical protein
VWQLILSALREALFLPPGPTPPAVKGRVPWPILLDPEPTDLVERECETLTHAPDATPSKGKVLHTIDELWELHDVVGSDPFSGCLAFVVDRRFAKERGTEVRLAVSFGRDRVRGWSKESSVPGSTPGYCFGFHLVRTRGRRIARLYPWWGSYRPRTPVAPLGAEEAVRAVLARLSDVEYARHVSPRAHDPLPLKVSDPLPLEEYEFVRAVKR